MSNEWKIGDKCWVAYVDTSRNKFLISKATVVKLVISGSGLAVSAAGTEVKRECAKGEKIVIGVGETTLTEPLKTYSIITSSNVFRTKREAKVYAERSLQQFKRSIATLKVHSSTVSVQVPPIKDTIKLGAQLFLIKQGEIHEVIVSWKEVSSDGNIVLGQDPSLGTNPEVDHIPIPKGYFISLEEARNTYPNLPLISKDLLQARVNQEVDEFWIRAKERLIKSFHPQ